MNRRTLLKALGAVGAGGAAVTGTGAFTNVTADRTATVSVEGDANAYLSLSGTSNENDEYLTTNSGELGIDLDSGNAVPGGGTGVNANAITVIENLFEVRNQGTQEITVEATPLTFLEKESGDTIVALVVPNSSFPGVTLGEGNAETYSLIVDVFPVGDSDLAIDDTITITAEATP